MRGRVHRGSCLCGGVAFEAEAPLGDVIACHCSQCRRTSGHFWAGSFVPRARFRLVSAATLRWFRSSPGVDRGFCATCGASLFWRPVDGTEICVAGGALDLPTGLKLAEHWHREDAGDYYSPEGPPPPPGDTAPELLACACLCGACAFDLPGPAGPVTACHCAQCRKLSGHYSASFDAGEDCMEWRRRDTLAEYRTPGGGTRGFCGRCGSSLWFRSAAGEVSVEAGSVLGPTGGRLLEHIFVASKGDYYEMDDGLPQSGGW
ncbi:GFA family protein [Defluviimonas sp. SAOS-178_SWC]|uniref:GFA family protein n=1 Tax=Defluviimonas sp. SAOS-178_SWC TaxID=3121287 RepID=UPI003221E802